MSPIDGPLWAVVFFMHTHAVTAPSHPCRHQGCLQACVVARSAVCWPGGFAFGDFRAAILIWLAVGILCVSDNRIANVEISEAIIEISKSPGFDSLSEARRQSLVATWVQFVTSLASMEQPDWGTLLSTILAALSEDEAKMFAEALEKIS